ncbi:MAG: putative lipoic acid-binding regulatory protein [Kiritimatiellia bacterium]|jgi:putative lipoic acid-binding regulatory protein
MERSRALDLLRSEHSFPGDFRFRVVVRVGAEPAVLSAISVLSGVQVKDVSSKPSRNGNYISLRVFTKVDLAETVLAVYEVIRGVDGVMVSL